VIAFEDIWREHKRFIVSVGAGLIAFFGGLLLVSSVDEKTKAARKQINTSEADIRTAVGELAGREGSEAGVAIALDKEVGPAIKAAVEFQPRPAFTLKEGDPLLVYRQAIEEVEKARAEALRRNISCPEDLGFVKDPPEDRVRVHVIGADLAERVLGALVAVGVKSIEAFRPGEVDYVRTVDEPEPGKEGAPQPPAGAAAAEGSEPDMLRRIPLRFTAVGPVDALERFLSSFQIAKSALELAAFRVSRAGEGLVRFEVEVAALALVPAAEAKAAKSAQSGGRRGGLQRLGGRSR
jgi:hypothetical protein